MKKQMMTAGIVAAMAITGAAANMGAATADQDIVDTAVAAGSFKTLVKALQAADLVETLKGAGPFTVFAPIDEAFAKLPAGTLEALLKPENKPKLRRILTSHVVAGKVMAADVVKTSSALDDGRRSLIRQTATFDPRGLLGRAYWYALLPVHEWMFSGLLHEIARRAKTRRIEPNGDISRWPSAGCMRDRKV
jgi:hypothetical protein